MKLSNALKIRDQLREKLGSMEPAEKRGYLLSVIEQSHRKVKSADDMILSAFARVFFVLMRLNSDSKQGTELLQQARSILAKATEENRKLRMLEKDVLIFLGNHYRTYGQSDLALQAYGEAIANEHNYDRKVRGLLNSARVYMSEGLFHKALAVGEDVQLDKLKDVGLKCYIVMLRARILLIMGYEDAAAKTLEMIENDKSQVPAVELEYRYLLLVSRINFADVDYFLCSYEVFIAWIDESEDEKTSAFYHLEKLILETFQKPDDVENKTATRSRISYLGRAAGEKSITAAALAFIDYLTSKNTSDDPFDKVVSNLFQLPKVGSHRLFQILVVFFADYLKSKKRNKKCMSLLCSYERYIRGLETGFSPKLLKGLSHYQSAIRSAVEDIKKGLPADLVNGFDEVGESLLMK